VPPGKVTAHFTSCPLAFISAKAAFSGLASTVAPAGIRSLATEIAWPLVFSRHRICIGTGLFSAVMVPSVIR
jgi:hypothetical protein